MCGTDVSTAGSRVDNLGGGLLYAVAVQMIHTWLIHLSFTHFKFTLSKALIPKKAARGFT